jgi:hypothetical protein
MLRRASWTANYEGVDPASGQTRTFSIDFNFNTPYTDGVIRRDSAYVVGTSGDMQDFDYGASLYKWRVKDGVIFLYKWREKDGITEDKSAFQFPFEKLHFDVYKDEIAGATEKNVDHYGFRVGAKGIPLSRPPGNLIALWPEESGWVDLEL